VEDQIVRCSPDIIGDEAGRYLIQVLLNLVEPLCGFQMTPNRAFPQER
jgi:hypothetical protein